MLQVKTPEEVLALIKKEFTPLSDCTELVPFTGALGRVLAEDIAAEEYVPDLRPADLFLPGPCRGGQQRHGPSRVRKAQEADLVRVPPAE